jgi:hypothetical protein
MHRRQRLPIRNNKVRETIGTRILQKIFMWSSHVMQMESRGKTEVNVNEPTGLLVYSKELPQMDTYWKRCKCSTYMAHCWQSTLSFPEKLLADSIRISAQTFSKL